MASNKHGYSTQKESTASLYTVHCTLEKRLTMDDDKGNKILEVQIEQSLVRLASQEGSQGTLKVSQRIRVRCSKKPISREDVGEKIEINFNELTYVSIGESNTVGTCVRLIFNQQMYATCGENAQKIIDWAQSSAKTPLSSRISKLPNVSFELVSDKVKIYKGEIILA